MAVTSRYALFLSALGSIATVCTSLGCEAKGSQQRAPRSEAVVADGMPRPSLFGERALAQALSALADAVRPPVRALSLSLSADRLILQAQHPSDAKRVVQYEYRDGHVGTAVPVELRGKGDLAPNLFSLEAVNLASIPVLAKLAIERVDPQDGRVDKVVVRRNLPVTADVQIRVFVDSPRRAGHLDADQSGKPMESR